MFVACTPKLVKKCNSLKFSEYIGIQKQICSLDGAMNLSVCSVPMKLFPSRVIDCPRVECSVSPFSGNYPFLNDQKVKCFVFVLSWDGEGIYSVRVNVLRITNDILSDFANFAITCYCDFRRTATTTCECCCFIRITCLPAVPTHSLLAAHGERFVFSSVRNLC